MICWFVSYAAWPGQVELEGQPVHGRGRGGATRDSHREPGQGHDEAVAQHRVGQSVHRGALSLRCKEPDAYQVTYTGPLNAQRPGWSGGDPDKFTALTVVRATQVLRRVFAATLAPFDLPPHQFSVLLHLVERPGISQADLARVVLATPQSVGRAGPGDGGQGLVERTRPPGGASPLRSTPPRPARPCSTRSPRTCSPRSRPRRSASTPRPTTGSTPTCTRSSMLSGRLDVSTLSLRLSLPGCSAACPGGSCVPRRRVRRAQAHD